MLGADAKSGERPVVLRNWRLFDDSRVCNKIPDASSSCAAYILFYLRRDSLPQPLAEPLAQLAFAQSYSGISNRVFRSVLLLAMIVVDMCDSSRTGPKVEILYEWYRTRYRKMTKL